MYVISSQYVEQNALCWCLNWVKVIFFSKLFQKYLQKILHVSQRSTHILYMYAVFLMLS